MSAQVLPGITLEEIDAKLTHVNTRIEKHGEEDVLAADLDIAWETTNADLAHFAPTLRSLLYMPDDEKNDSFPGIEVALTRLRFPAIEAIRWQAGEIVGGTFTIHRAVSGNDLVFGDAKIGKWRIEAKQGGSVTILFRVQCFPESKQRGKLLDILEHGVITASVQPPAATEVEGDA